jgi:2'-5' RNA ligase
MSNGVVALLDRETEERVRALRRALEPLLGTSALDALPLPHMSLVVAGRVDEGPAAEAVERLAGAVKRTALLCEPWTLFVPPAPSTACAVVRGVTRTPEVDALRAAVAAELEAHVGGVSPFTTTATWNPHVTLASQGVERAQLGAVVDHLVELDEPPWEARVERLALIVEEGPRHRLHMAVELAE